MTLGHLSAYAALLSGWISLICVPYSPLLFLCRVLDPEGREPRFAIIRHTFFMFATWSLAACCGIAFALAPALHDFSAFWLALFGHLFSGTVLFLTINRLGLGKTIDIPWYGMLALLVSTCAVAASTNAGTIYLLGKSSLPGSTVTNFDSSTLLPMALSKEALGIYATIITLVVSVWKFLDLDKLFPKLRKDGSEEPADGQDRPFPLAGTDPGASALAADAKALPDRDGPRQVASTPPPEGTPSARRRPRGGATTPENERKKKR